MDFGKNKNSTSEFCIDWIDWQLLKKLGLKCFTGTQKEGRKKNHNLVFWRDNFKCIFAVDFWLFLHIKCWSYQSSTLLIKEYFKLTSDNTNGYITITSVNIAFHVSVYRCALTYEIIWFVVFCSLSAQLVPSNWAGGHTF